MLQFSLLSLYIHLFRLRTLNDSSKSPTTFVRIKKASSIMSSKVVTNLFRRGYAVAAERVTGQAVKRAAVESPAAGEKAAAEKEAAAFWMRDPKSGNWLPETHFDDVDAADLRKQLLPSNRKKAF